MVQARFINDINTVEVRTNEAVNPVKVSANTFIRDHNQLLGRDLPDQHPISAITGLEEALNRLDTFIYEQAVASDTWEIEHNLGRFPSVEVVDTAGNKFFPAVQWINENKLIITMNGATKGKAFLN